VRVHIVNDQDDAFGLRVLFIRQQAQLFGTVAPGAPLGDPYFPPTPSRFNR
jgi:hypothetical protein